MRPSIVQSITSIVAIVCITYLLGLAAMHGRNGLLLALGVGTISGLAGYSAGKLVKDLRTLLGKGGDS